MAQELLSTFADEIADGEQKETVDEKANEIARREQKAIADGQKAKSDPSAAVADPR